MMLSQQLYDLPTPCYLIDLPRLTQNLRVLQEVRQRAGCKILLAQKAFSMYALYPLIGSYLDGTAASGLFEARLGHEEMGGETHVFAAAYRPDEMDEILEICDHVSFNSFSEWERYRGKALRAGKAYGVRVNPEHSTQSHAVYDPCAPGSRLGVVQAHFPTDLPEGITGLHFHTLCEQNSDALVATLAAVERKFGPYFSKLRWINMGGGHHITRADYDIERLVGCVRGVRETYGLEVYLEPGEAVALEAGYLVSTVLDVVENDGPIAILDASAACHMPDVLEMPYRPEARLLRAPGGAGVVARGAREEQDVREEQGERGERGEQDERGERGKRGEWDDWGERGGAPGDNAYTVRLAGPTCLAGDVIGAYSFTAPPAPGDRVVFYDMAIYTMVKNNTFNGMNLPSIALLEGDDRTRVVKSFGYEDFKGRL